MISRAVPGDLADLAMVPAMGRVTDLETPADLVTDLAMDMDLDTRPPGIPVTNLVMVPVPVTLLRGTRVMAPVVLPSGMSTTVARPSTFAA